MDSIPSMKKAHVAVGPPDHRSDVSLSPLLPSPHLFAGPPRLGRNDDDGRGDDEKRYGCGTHTAPSVASFLSLPPPTSSSVPARMSGVGSNSVTMSDMLPMK